MPDWLNQVMAGAVIAIITGVLVALLRRWLAARHRAALASGKPFRFDASLQGNTTPYPRHFRAGWVYVGVGAPTWKPRFSLLRRTIELPVAARVEQVRKLSGWGEILRVDTECRVIVAHAGDVIVELAILPREVVTALRALQSSTGGGWQVPVPAASAYEPSR